MPNNIADLDAVIARNSELLVGLAVVVLIILAITSLQLKHPTEGLKKLLFFSIIGVSIVTTLFLGGSTLYLNSVSFSQGPVHYHADFEIYKCGEEITLPTPKGFSNKIGTATLHSHNDKRIHLEGVVVTPKDASLGKFVQVIGGAIVRDLLTVPTDNGLVNLNSGQNCQGKPAELQVFVYKTTGTTYSQEKISNPADYTIAPDSGVPPGDCIIVELDALKEKTDKLCRSYAVARQIGKVKEAL